MYHDRIIEANPPLQSDVNDSDHALCMQHTVMSLHVVGGRIYP